MMDRRSFLLALAAAGAVRPASALASAWAPRDGDVIAFDVTRNGGSFGRHILSFGRSGEALTVAIDIELKVKIGPVTAYHYVQTAEEQWKDGRLQSLKARTRRGGKWREVSARATADGLLVESGAYRAVAPADVIPSTHWNVNQFRSSRMLSTETGELMPVKVADLGTDAVSFAGARLPARRFRLDSDIDAEFWFDDRARWVGCAFNAEGQDVRYVPRALPV